MVLSRWGFIDDIGRFAIARLFVIERGWYDGRYGGADRKRRGAPSMMGISRAAVASATYVYDLFGSFRRVDI